MAVGAEFIEFIKDQMSGFAPVAVRRMFGGAGVSYAGVTFAIIVDETLYLKEGPDNAADFVQIARQLVDKELEMVRTDRLSHRGNHPGCFRRLDRRDCLQCDEIERRLQRSAGPGEGCTRGRCSAWFTD